MRESLLIRGQYSVRGRDHFIKRRIQLRFAVKNGNQLFPTGAECSGLLLPLFPYFLKWCILHLRTGHEESAAQKKEYK